MKENAKHPVSMRLTPEARRIINRISRHLGIGTAAVIEIALREKADRVWPSRMNGAKRKPARAG